MILGAFQLDVDGQESNLYVVGCEETRATLLVDAGAFDPRVVQFLERHRLQLAAVFITHDHFDHSGAVDAFVARYQPRVFSATGSPGGRHGEKVAPGMELEIGALRGRVLDTRGHTSDSLSLALPGMVFTGDALFAGSIGGTGSSGQKQQEITNIREQIFSLPEDWEVHPGHGPSSTVGVEKRFNPFFLA